MYRDRPGKIFLLSDLDPFTKIFHLYRKENKKEKKKKRKKKETERKRNNNRATWLFVRRESDDPIGTGRTCCSLSIEGGCN